MKKDKGQKCLLVSGPINKCVQSIMGYKVEQWVWVQVQTETGTPAEYKGSKLSQHLSTHSWSLCTQGQSTGDRGGGVKRLFRYGLTMKKFQVGETYDGWVSMAQRSHSDFLTGSSSPLSCGCVLAMIHLTRQHLISAFREKRGFCHFPESFTRPGAGSTPLGSPSRPSTTLPSAWRERLGWC